MLPNLSRLGSDPRLGSEGPTGMAPKKRRLESQEAPAFEGNNDALPSAQGRWWPVSDGAFAIAMKPSGPLDGYTNADRIKFRNHTEEDEPPCMVEVDADPSNHQSDSSKITKADGMWTHVQYLRRQSLPSTAGTLLSMDVWTARPNLAGYEPDVDARLSDRKKQVRSLVADAIGGNETSLPAIQVPKEIYLIATITDLVGCKRCITAIGIVPIEAHDEDAAFKGLMALMDACPFYGLSE